MTEGSSIDDRVADYALLPTKTLAALPVLCQGIRAVDVPDTDLGLAVNRKNMQKGRRTALKVVMVDEDDGGSSVGVGGGDGGGGVGDCGGGGR